MGLSFELASPGIPETAHPGETPSALALRRARAKADRIAEAQPDAWVIGSDQVALLDDGSGVRILGKPGTVSRCIEQLTASSGRVVSFLTAVAVVRRRDAASIEFLDTTRVKFRALERTMIERYVERESPLDCAGGFKSEGLGIALCESIDSADPTALIGLPLIRLAAALRAAGFEIP